MFGREMQADGNGQNAVDADDAALDAAVPMPTPAKKQTA
jgi:hypothetical protein